jgi:hypothetical protein
MPKNTINETQKSSVEPPYKKLITIAAFIFAAWGGISTAGHFIGYSFLQGRIAGHGLGEHELTLSSFESIMQAGYATKAIFDELFVGLMSFFDMTFWGLFLTVMILGVLLKILLWDLNKKEENSRVGNLLSRKFTALPRWIKGIIIYPTVSLLGFMYLMLIILLIFYGLWANLTLAHAVGYRIGQQDIATKPCVPIASLDNKRGYVAGCTQLYDAKNELYTGKIIHSNKEMSLLQTNSESILFDKDRNIIACSAILDVALQEKQAKNKCIGE